MHQIVIMLCVAVAAALPAHAVEPPAAPPDDLDALSLADKAPSTPDKPVQAWRLFVEAAGGQGSLRATDERVDTTRASFDARFDAALAPGLRGVLSDRIDAVHSNGVPRGRDVNTLREAIFLLRLVVVSRVAFAGDLHDLGERPRKAKGDRRRKP